MSLAASALGQRSEYRERYAPELLFPVERAAKRAELGISERSLPFVGEDLWNAYEISWLDPKGKPVVAVAEFRFPADSPRLVESKSLKLYLNSFNQERVGSPTALAETLRRDLAGAAGATVGVVLSPLGPETPTRRYGLPAGVLLDSLDIDIGEYDGPRPDVLTAGAETVVEETLYTHLLKSNCLVTGQPDWATLFVRYRGRPIDRAGLLRYVVSFRRHHEFHEQCVERVFIDLMRRCAPQTLQVWARYTRRGGLDINPWRSNTPAAAPANEHEIRQ